MANIIELLQNILSARYGKDVRQSIHDAIKTCYDDGKAGVIDYEARAELPNKADLENGKVKLSQIPKVALDIMKKVQTDAERFALTTEEVQNGDTVKVIDTELMYLVVDDTKLDSEDGYTGYSASVNWETIDGRPDGLVKAVGVEPPVEITDPAPLYRADVVNDLNSTDTDKPLSAAMGKELADKILRMKEYSVTSPTLRPYASGVVNIDISNLNLTEPPKVAISSNFIYGILAIPTATYITVNVWNLFNETIDANSQAKILVLY